MENKNVKGLGLTKKILLGFTLFIVLPLILMGWKFFDSSKSLVETSLAHENLNGVRNFEDYYLKTFNSNLEFFLTLWSHEAELNDIFKSKATATQYKREWSAALEGYPEITAIYYGSNEGKMFIVPNEPLPSDFDPRERPWYQFAIKTPSKITWTQPYKDASSGDYILSVSKAVSSEDGKTVLGVLSIDVHLKELSSIIKESKFGKNGFLMIADKNGQTLAAGDTDTLGKDIRNLTWFKPIYSQKEGSYFETIDGVPSIISYSTDDKTGWKVIGIIPRSELETDMKPLVSLMMRVLMYTSIWAVAAVALLTLYANWVIVKPIKVLMNMMSEAESGNLALEVKHQYNDEIGSLFKSFERMIIGQKDMLIQVLVTATKLSSSADQTHTIAKQSTETAQAQNFAMGELSKSVEDMSQAISDVSTNMTLIATNMDQVANAVQDMGAAASDVAENMVETAAAVGEVVDSLSELDSKIDQISYNAKMANDHGLSSNAIVKEGKMVVDSTMKEMNAIHLTMNDLSSVIKELGDAAEQIGEIVEVIDDISEQTNLLSLNASIEAARAGEHGKGFAVVASAISRLSEKSSDSTKDIERLIKKIQHSVKDAIVATEKSAQRIERGVELVTHTEVAFINIADAVESTNQLVGDIANSTTEQSHASKTIMAATSRVNDLTMHVSAASQEQLATIEEFISTTEKINMLTQEVNESGVVQAANSEELAATAQSLSEMTEDLSSTSEEAALVASELSSQSKDLVGLVSKFRL